MSAHFSTSLATLFSAFVGAGWRATLLTAAPAGPAVVGSYALLRIESNQGPQVARPSSPAFPFLLR
ncbi:hypothetical protein ACFPAF_18840 [Hymenobacter endophyticus]|uniref:Secreted protein n=1 Tax=Hymenobacter endophyticus TaxID=3076335 RepID=A0ABU3TM61_9BACT|nr:hypothetical protein [Hymenobacter endophyticus]MDU0372464.1 hypothetical protein [Hymenobacter endophyticus]